MITLRFPSQSSRWVNSGLFFNDWSEYFFTLGYFCNRNHYYHSSKGLISIHIEPNDENGAYAKEGRIHYYGDDDILAHYFPALYKAKSSGVGNVTYRINCNDYVYSLLEDFDFMIEYRGSNIVADIVPYNNQDLIVNNKVNNLIKDTSSENNIIFDKRAFLDGYNLIT